MKIETATQIFANDNNFMKIQPWIKGIHDSMAERGLEG
jgi:hypothetical protein